MQQKKRKEAQVEAISRLQEVLEMNRVRFRMIRMRIRELGGELGGRGEMREE